MEDAVDGDRVDRHLGAVDVLLDDVGRRCGTPSSAASIAAGSSASVRTSVSPRCPWRSGALTTQGGTGSSSSRGCGTPAAAKRSRWRDFVVASAAVAPSIGCGRPSRSATRAATPTGQSAPGETIPSTFSRPGEAVDARLVLGRDERALVRVGEAGRRGVAVDGDHEEVALACRAQEPDLRGPCS